jgi:hypothetical protein
MNIQYDKKPSFPSFDGDKTKIFDWITGVEIQCASIGWKDVLLNINIPDEPAPGSTAAVRNEYNRLVSRREQMSADCMSSLFLATSGIARDCIKFTQDPSLAWAALKKKFVANDMGTLFIKLVEIVFSGMRELGDEHFVTRFKEARLELDQLRAHTQRPPIEADIISSLFVMGLSVPQYSSVKSKWTLKKEGEEISFDELEHQVIKRRQEIEQEAKTPEVLFSHNNASGKPNTYNINPDHLNSNAYYTKSNNKFVKMHKKPNKFQSDILERKKEYEFQKYNATKVAFCDWCKKNGHTSEDCYHKKSAKSARTEDSEWEGLSDN